MLPAIDLTRNLLGLLSRPAKDAKLVLSLLSIPYRKLSAQRHGYANLADIFGNLIQSHRSFILSARAYAVAVDPQTTARGGRPPHAPAGQSPDKSSPSSHQRCPCTLPPTLVCSSLPSPACFFISPLARE